jgi:hypothetical protein
VRHDTFLLILLWCSEITVYLCRTLASKKLIDRPSDSRWMYTEHWWNSNWQGNFVIVGEIVSQCHFLRHRSQMDCPISEPGSPRCE